MDVTALKKKSAPVTREFEFSPGFIVELEYISLSEGQARILRCTKIVNGIEVRDQDKMLAELGKSILAWRGLTVAGFAALVPIDYAAEDAAKSVPCTDENKLELLREAWLFRVWLDEKTTELVGFKELERKNSLGSPSGGSTPAA